MPHPRRRAPRTPLRRYSFAVLVIAAVMVAGALVNGSAVLVGVAAVLAVVMSVAAAAFLVQDALDARQAAAAANAALAASFTDLFAIQATDHQHELEHLVGRMSTLTGRVAELTARNTDLVARNTDLEFAAALAAAGRSRAAMTSKQDQRSTVVNLPVQPFDHSPVQHARASGE